eukprot:1744507-Alexandrium_andersonii.AAC.1
MARLLLLLLPSTSVSILAQGVGPGGLAADRVWLTPACRPHPGAGVHTLASPSLSSARYRGRALPGPGG